MVQLEVNLYSLMIYGLIQLNYNINRGQHFSTKLDLDIRYSTTTSLKF